MDSVDRIGGFDDELNSELKSWEVEIEKKKKNEIYKEVKE